MVQKPWFKIFVWFMTTFFFFLAAGVVISVFRPGPSESDVMRFMQGMMATMGNSSIMGLTMSIEDNSLLNNIIIQSTELMLPIIAISIVLGFLLRFFSGGKKDV